MRTQKKVKKSDVEWRTDLSDESYRVTREKGTERPFENAYHDLKTPAMYHCISAVIPRCLTPITNSIQVLDGRASSTSIWRSD